MTYKQQEKTCKLSYPAFYIEGIFMNKGLFLIITDAVISFEKVDVLFIT